jgi:uncharacterized membrane protein (DUF373 family)
MKNRLQIKNYYNVLIPLTIFLVALVIHLPFYRTVTILLEFIVILEVFKMIDEFIKQRRISLRYAIDTFIIFLTRDVILLMSQPVKKKDDILFILLVILIFFIFRILALIFSPVKFTKIKKGML